MARPHKKRRVERPPQFSFFKPAGVPLRDLELSFLGVDEFEAIRLSDLEGGQQVEVAEKMGISQPTLNRLLSVAREKVADAIVNGKALRIEGGPFQLAGKRKFVCLECGNEWLEPFGTGRPKRCSDCGSESLKRKN